MLMGPLPVKRPLGQGALGSLVLQLDGSWALVFEGEGRPKLVQGQLVHVVRAGGGAEEPQRHLMAVVAPRKWGAILQRLDAGRIPDNAEVYALPREDQGAVRFPGACEGEGDPAASACLASAPAGTRWQLWPLRADRTAAIPEGQRGWRLELTRVAVAHRDVAQTRVWEAAPTDRGARWLAMPLPGEYVPAPAPTVVVTGCGQLKTTLAVVTAGQHPKSGHPLIVEAAAYDQLADAFVRCEGGKIHGVAASLLRPPLETAAGELLGPPVLTHDALVVPGGAAEAALVADMLGAIARGDALLAELYGERLLVALGEGKGAEDLALRLAQLVAAAGRPEAALRLAQGASAGRWRRDGDVRWQLTQIAVWAALGRQRESAAAERDLSVLLGRVSAEEPLMPWLYWRSVRVMLAAGARVELARFEGISVEWMLALRLLEVLGAAERLDALPVVEREALDEAFGAAGAAALWEARAGVTAAPCEGACALDFYGRRLAGRGAALTIEQVRAVGRLGVWPWTLAAGQAWTPTPAQTDAQAIALLSTLGGDAPASDALLSRVIAAFDDPARREALCGEAGLTALSYAAPVEVDQRWLLRVGLPLACSADKAMIEEVEAQLTQAGSGGEPLWVALRGWVLMSPEPQRAARLERAAQLARTRNTPAGGAACARLWMAYGAAQLAAEQVEAAATSLERAAACPIGKQEALRAELEALGWLVRRERTISDTSASEGAAARIKAADEAARLNLPPRCASFFDASFAPVAVLEPWSAGLANAIRMPARDSEIMTASRMERDAAAYILEAAALLDRGDVEGARARVATARGLYERLGLEGAQARLDLIERGLAPAAAAPRKPAAKAPTPALSGRDALKALDAQPALTPDERARFIALSLVYHWGDPVALTDRLLRADACR
jgi:hypothetical protein